MLYLKDEGDRWDKIVVIVPESVCEVLWGDEEEWERVPYGVVEEMASWGLVEPLGGIDAVNRRLEGGETLQIGEVWLRQVRVLH